MSLTGDAGQKALLRQHVIDQLTAVGGQTKSDEIIILCPFHNDHNPSLRVHIGHRVHPGSFFCFSCRAQGGWNKLAHVLKLEKVTAPEKTVNEHGISDDPTDPFRVLAGELAHTDILQTPEYRVLKGTEELPDDFGWRGLGRAFYQRMGGAYFWTENTEYLHFPLEENGSYRGYTLCAVASTAPKFTKYQIFAEAKKVLFLYDHIPSGAPVVLCEGHFDALRLMALGFNAVAIFGVNNWSAYKKALLVAKNPPRIVIAFDGDKAGYDASVEIFNDLCDGIDTDIFYLPPQNPALDPGNMPDEHLNALREKVYG